MTCLRFDRQKSFNGSPFMIGSPTELLLPVSKSSIELFTLAISVRQLKYKVEEVVGLPAVHSLQLLTDDLALHHAFLGNSSDRLQEAPVLMIAAKVKSAPLVVDDDDFIIPDEFSQKKRRASAKMPKIHKVNYTRNQHGNNERVEIGRTAENQAVHRRISTFSKQQDLQDIIDIADDLQDLLLDDGIRGLEVSSKTLFEQALSPSLKVGELAETSDALSDLMSLARPKVPGEPDIAVQRLRIPSWASPMAVPPDQLEFPGLYNHIVEHQLAPLADEIPPRFRLGRERLARTIAAEVILSISRVDSVDQPEDSQEKEDSQEQEDSQHPCPPFHSKGKAKTTDLFPASSQLSDFMSSQTLPTSSPSSPRAASTIMSGTSTSLSSASSRTALSRLSRHVTLSVPRSSRASRRKRGLLAVVAHWDIGHDPSTYNYAAKLRELERQRHERNMTEKQRLKAREKAERLLKRQRKENEKAWSMRHRSIPTVMSSQARGGSQFGDSQYGRSSPTLPLSSPPMMERNRDRGFAASSQMVAPPTVGSWQAPARRGDRPAKRKKVKREGF